jgi:prepilin-type N-terminal cleavage/methylation domain-containing protein
VRRRGLGRRGFTLIELLVVFVVLGILSSIAILKYIDLKKTAQAARVASDFNAIKIAVYSYYTDATTWPSEVGPGVIPPELVPNLNTGYTVIQDEYTLDSDYFPVSGSGPGGYIVGVSVTTTDPALMTKLEQVLGRNMPFISAGGSLTYIIVGADGAS